MSLYKLEKNLNHALNSFGWDSLLYGNVYAQQNNGWVEKEGVYTFTMDTPGVNVEDLKIESDHSSITVTALRTIGGKGEVSRTFGFPPEAERTKLKADYRSGVLVLSVPVTEAAKPRLVPINSI